MVGRLIGYTRQLDVQMRDEGTVQALVRDFCEGGAARDAAAPRRDATPG
jgi:hypothetical protein